MPASYPSSVKSFITKVNGVDWPDMSHINDPQLEIVAIETELGTLPKGSNTDVKTRLNAIEAGTNVTIGAISQMSMAIGTSDINTPNPGTTYSDMADMSVTLTTIANSKVLVLFNGIFVPSAQTADLMIELRIDDVTQVWQRKEPISAFDSTAAVWYFDIGAVPLQYYKANLSAAEHVFKIRWKVDAGTVYQYGTTANLKGGGPRTLTVIELKR